MSQFIVTIIGGPYDGTDLPLPVDVPPFLAGAVMDVEKINFAGFQLRPLPDNRWGLEWYDLRDMSKGPDEVHPKLREFIERYFPEQQFDD